jgi:hypothetical protein
MDYESAVQWVKENKPEILIFASRYKKFAPYSNDDFLSAAREAAIVAQKHIEGTDISINKYFWKCYWTVLSDFVPNR